MTTYEEIDFNPLEKTEALIKEIDSVLSSCGLISATQANLRNKSGTNDGLLQVLAQLFEAHSFAKLEAKYDMMINLFGELVALIDSEPEFSNLALPTFPNIGHQNHQNLQNIITYVAQAKKSIQPLIDDAEGYRKRNQLLSIIEAKKKDLDKGFFYEFTEGDLNRAQELINELRSEISKSDLFDEGHRQRLLRRLEKLQGELHKKMGDVDRIWGLVGDAGVAIGKFGKDAKPFVDRIKELSQIAWRTQSHKEELPSGSSNPLLGSDNEDNEQV